MVPKEAGSAKPRGIFPGWLMVIGGAIMCFWGHGIFTYGFGLYVKPLIAEFGWSRAQLSLAYSFHRLEGGLEGPFGGIATDKWGPRVVNLAGIVMLGLGFILMYFVNSLWQYYVIWITAAIGGNLGLSQPLDAALANWFVRRRGLAVALMRAGTAFCGPVVLPLVAWLLVIYGWRIACPIVGLVTLIIGIPITWIFIRPHRPEYYGWLPDGRRVGEEEAADREAVIQKGVEYAAEVEEVEFTVRQAIRDRIFWIATVHMTLRGMVSPVVIAHTVPMLTDRGIDPMVAAAAMGAFVLMTFPGRMLFGWLGDRVRVRQLKYMVILGTLLEALGLFILVRATSTIWVWVYLVVYGFAHGANVMIWVPVRGRYWGRKAFATIQGSMQPITMIAGIIAPVYAGWTYDTTGSYISVFVILIICLLVSAVVMYFCNPPKPPEKIGRITEVV